MRDRDAVKRKAIVSNDQCDWTKYKKLRNTINKTSKLLNTIHLIILMFLFNLKVILEIKPLTSLLPVVLTIQR